MFSQAECLESDLLDHSMGLAHENGGEAVDYPGYTVKFDKFQNKINEIANYFKINNPKSPTLIFTGGEAFFYKDITTSRNKFNLCNLIDYTCECIPEAKILIKSSGWFDNKNLEQIYSHLCKRYDNSKLLFTLGFNLYQKAGLHAAERLDNMINNILSRQSFLCIDTIYDKKNFDATFEILKKIIGKYDNSAKFLKKAVKCEPHLHQSFLFKIQGKDVRLDLGPSYDPSNDPLNNFFWDEPICGKCRTIIEGPDHIFYNYDFSLYHCNDSFVDGSISPISPETLKTIHQQHKYLENSFKELKNIFEHNKILFKNRKERCFYCTKFLLNYPNRQSNDKREGLQMFHPF